MKSDLDRLMQERRFNAIVVMGQARENHALRYLTQAAAVTYGIVVKKHGEPPVLICGPMERDEAAKSGLKVLTTTDFGYPHLLKETGSFFDAQVLMVAAIFEQLSIRGTVSFYGLEDPGQAYMMLTRLSTLLPDIAITGETETTLFDEAYTTKDAAELEAIRSVAVRTNAVMAEVMEFIKSHAVQDQHLVGEDGQPLTVGDVKRFLRSRLVHHELEDGGETIFALGRDAGVPHSRGENGDILRLGASIIFDLFARGMDNGYYHDMTRTFCLGYAPPEVHQAHSQVMQVFNTVMSTLKVGELCARYQDLACDVFEEHGHPTPRSHPGTEEGYVHSLGHGLGLQIHARPRLSTISTETFQPGQVFTIEPGLYYPERGFGVRVEDTMYIDEGGHFHSLTPFPKDLVIPVAQS